MVFKDIPVQVCQFHQQKTVTKYLTRRPKTEAGVELRRLSLTLTRTTELVFTRELVAWEKKWHDFINEKTTVLGTKHWYYTHKNVRSAYRSLKHNLSYLFTYQKYPELTIPNLTNPLIFDSSVNHGHFEEADTDWFIVAAHAEPRKTRSRPNARANDYTAVGRYGSALTY